MHYFLDSFELLTKIFLNSTQIDTEALKNLEKQIVDGKYLTSKWSQKINYLIIVYFEATQELRFNLSTNDTVDMIEAFKAFSNDNQRTIINKFLNEVN